ncbi:MAG: GAF domain-containing protein [Chlorobi bacterium]|nr:GAF domain-containing protein [Chlorobiota bacterium]
MNKKGIKVLLVLFLWVVPVISPAQYYHFGRYSLEEGLPQSEVMTIVEDEPGYLWVGTNGGGLCRFNGKNFDVYTTKDGLLDNIIFGLFLDDNYDLWVGSPKGVMRYDGKKFHKIFSSDTATFVDEVRFFETAGGNIWVFGNLSDGKQGFFNVRNDTVVNACKMFNELTPDNRVLYVTSLNSNHLIVTTINGYYDLISDKLSPSDILPVSGKYLYVPLESDRSNNIWTIALDKKHPERKLMLFSADGKSKDIVLPDKLNAGGIAKSYQDREGGIWFSILNYGLVRYLNGEWKVFNEKNGLPIDNVRAVYEDAEGNFWLGTLGAGLARYSGDMFILFDTRSGISDNIINSIYQDSEGIYYFGGNSSGLNVYDGKTIRVVYKDKGSDAGFIGAIYEDGRNNLLLGTMTGLCRYDGEKITDCWREYGFSYPYPVLDIKPYGDTILFATYGAGLVKSYKGKAEAYNKKTSAFNAITVSNIFVDSKKRAWLITDNGIWQYEADSVININEKYGLNTSYFTQAAEDKAGNIWFAVFTEGLLRFNGEKFSVVDMSDGLTSDNIYSVIADKEGNIWAGTQNGVDKLTLNPDGEILSIDNFGKYDGFVGMENNGAANYLDRDGNLWFGTIKGAIKYNPRKRRINYLPPPVYVSGMEIAFKQVSWDKEPYKSMYDSIIPWINMPAGLKLPHNLNHISFFFDGLCYTVPEKVKFKWKLYPVEKDYLPETQLNRAVYASLPPGNYTFYVKACNNSGIWNEEPAVFSFTIEPAWWQTVTIKIMVLLLLTLLVYVIFRIWVQHNRLVKSEMKSILEVKSIEMQKRKEELKQCRQEIGVLKNEIKEINTLIDKYSEGLRKISLLGREALSGNVPETVFMNSYSDLSSVMSVRLYGIALYNDEQNTLDFKYLINNGERAPFITFPMDDKDRLSVHSFLNTKEIIIADFDVEYKKYVNALRPVPGDIDSRSVIFMPLVFNKKTIGVLTVQSSEKDAYGEQDVTFVRIVAEFLSVSAGSDIMK